VKIIEAGLNSLHAFFVMWGHSV